MKPVLLSLALALLMVGCGDGIVDYEKLQDRNGTTYLPNEKTPFTGRAEGFYDNGQKRIEGNYKDGKRDGLATEWYDNGQKSVEESFKDGKRDGLSTEWHGNGLKRYEQRWKDGKRDGVWTSWYEDGQKKWERTVKDGPFMDYKRMDYKLMSMEVWKPNGEKCPVTNVKNGNGVEVWYHEKDGTESLRWTYKDGKMVKVGVGKD